MLSLSLATYAYLVTLLPLSIGSPIVPLPPSLGNQCHDVKFTIRGSVQQLDWPKIPDLTANGSVAAYLGTFSKILPTVKNHTFTKTFKIAGTYCPATASVPGTTNTIQIMVHGATYTKEYFQHGSWGTGNTKYSWSDAANARGYPTLSIDRLCNGQSTRLAPRNCQYPIQLEAIHQVIQQVRQGTQRKVGKYGKIVLVGHSFGSIFVSSIASVHPNDADVLVLTGFPGGGSNNNLGVAAQVYTAARIADPVRFGNLPSGYFTGGSETARANAFYVGAFDHSIPPLDFATRGTQAVTETLGLPSVQGALDFRGAVHVLTAEFDPQFFNHTANDYTKDRTLLTTTVPNNFPKKSSYQYYVPPNTGHDLDWHYSFPTTVKVLYDSLNPAGSRPRPIPQGAISALPRS